MNFRLPSKRSFGKIGVDLDDTLAQGVWPDPEIGPINETAKDMVLFYHDNGYAVEIFTSRPASHAPRIWRWLEDNGLSRCIYDVRTDKPHYDWLIDDRALNFPDGIDG